MTTPQRERHPAPEVPSTGIASHQAAESTSESSPSAAVSEDTENYWTDRREHFMQWLPCASRPELEARALREFDRAEGVAFLIAEQHRRDDLTAQREASYAVSAALDWTAISRNPSHAELVRRRSVVQ